MKYLLNILILAFGSLAFGQGNNPFDIPQNTDSTQSAKVMVIAAGQDSNDHSTKDTSILSEKVPVLSGLDGEIIKSANPFDIRQDGLSADKSEIKREKKDSKERTHHGILQINTEIIVLVYSLIMLIILTLAISMNKARFITMLKACVNSNYIRTLYRDTKAWSNGQSIILYLIFFFNGAFIIWLINLKLNLTDEVHLFIIVAMLIAIYMVRHLIMWLLSTIYPTGVESGIHSYSVALHNQVYGVVALPLIVALEFLPPATTSAIMIVAGVLALANYLLRQGKSLLMTLGIRGFNPFYFFIYLCAIEIAPILVAYKILIGAL